MSLVLIPPSIRVYNHYNRVRANLAITERGLRMEPELEDAPDSTSEASFHPMSNCTSMGRTDEAQYRRSSQWRHPS